MFTGIVEGLGTVSGMRSAGRGKRLTVESDFGLDQTKIGDSICVSGVCLTVVKIAGQRFDVDVSPETLEKTTFSRVKTGERVNLERAMRFSDRIDGHLVTGHIDGTGIIKQRENLDNAIIVTFRVPPPIARYLIMKGSVAVDGISLTINTCGRDEFSVSIIPHSAKITTIGFKDRGSQVNIETDMIGKYVERFLTSTSSSEIEQSSERSGLDMEFLTRTGFI